MKKFAVLTILMATAVAAQANVIVSWGPANGIVSGAQAITELTTFDDSGFQSPATGANYNPTGTEVLSPDFYASISTNPLASFRIHDGASFDLLGRWQDSNASAAGTKSIMLAWDVTSTDTVSEFKAYQFSEYGGMSNRELRFLVQDGAGDWFASQVVQSMPGVGNTDVTSSAGSLTWVDYTPHTAGVVTFGSAASPSLTDVDKVGYFYKWDTDGTGGIYMTGFEVSAIPEPASLSLMALAGGGLLLVCRRMDKA